MARRLTDEERRLRAILEEDWRMEYRRHARLCGWKAYHTHRSDRSDEGFPDDVLVRERVIWIEAKTMEGKLSPAQEGWRDALLSAGEEWYLWRPSDGDLMRRVLAPVAPLISPGGVRYPVH